MGPRNGGPPLERIPLDVLERVVRFTIKERSLGGEVYLGASGIPFTAEGKVGILKGIRVNLRAIRKELKRAKG